MKNLTLLSCFSLCFILFVDNARAGGSSCFKKTECDLNQKCKSSQKCDEMAQRKSMDAQKFRERAKKMLEMAQQKPEKASLCQQIAQSYNASAEIRDKQASAIKNQDSQTLQALEQDFHAVKQHTKLLCQQLWNKEEGKKCDDVDKKKCETQGSSHPTCASQSSSADSSKSTESLSSDLASQPSAGKGWLDEISAK